MGVEPVVQSGLITISRRHHLIRLAVIIVFTLTASPGHFLTGSLPGWNIQKGVRSFALVFLNIFALGHFVLLNILPHILL